MVAVGLLEDDSLLRSALSEVLSNKGLRVSISSGSVDEFLIACSRNHIDCAVLDLHLGSGATGIDVAQKLISTYPKIGIVFLTSFDDPRLVGSSKSLVPEGSVYLQKHLVNDTSILIQAISDAISKGPIVRVPGNRVLGLLSDNQIEILALIAGGLSNSEIARIRNVSEKSVEATITRIAKTLNLKKEPAQNYRVHMARVFFRARGVPFEDR